MSIFDGWPLICFLFDSHSCIETASSGNAMCSVKQRDNGALWPFNVIKKTGTNRPQPVGDLLLLVNINMGHVFYRFRDTMTKTPETAVLPCSFT